MTLHPRVAVLDTNVLLLHLAGKTDPTLLQTFKRIDHFAHTDLDLLAQTLRPFTAMMTTPHVLTEASNFVDQAPLYRRQELIAAFRRFVEEHVERHEAALTLVGRPEFSRLALADTGLTALSAHAVIITTDYRLANEIGDRGGHANNFNHLRGQFLLPRH